jgi:Fe-S-cluster containining protein
MICLRCGYCCINLSVIIIHPDYIQKELKIEDLPE